MKLLLFDIDGTLVNTGGAGLRAINRAFEELYGHTKILDGISLAGRTDDLSMMDAYEKAKLTFSCQELTRFKSVYFNLLQHELDNSDSMLMPGIELLIPRLLELDNVCIALLTGNWERSGRAKIDGFGLNDFFSFVL